MMKTLYQSTSNSQTMNNTSQNNTISNTITSSLSLRSIRFLCILLAASTTMSVKSFTIETSSTAINVPKIVTDATIRSMTKNNVLSLVLTTSNEKNNNIAHSIEDPYAFLVEHEAVNSIEPESIWKKRYLVDTVTPPSSSSTILQNDNKKQNLPTVQLNRFTNNNEILLNYDTKNNVDLVQASAKTNVRNFYDLNTPWIDILIQTEQQKHQLMLANSNNNQYQLTV